MKFEKGEEKTEKGKTERWGKAGGGKAKKGTGWSTFLAPKQLLGLKRSSHAVITWKLSLSDFCERKYLI